MLLLANIYQYSRSRDTSFSNAQRNLCISLRDFAPNIIDYPIDAIQQKITISYHHLERSLAELGKDYQRSQADEELMDELPPGTLKCLREESPSNELSAEDERNFQELEDDDEKRADKTS